MDIKQTITLTRIVPNDLASIAAVFSDISDRYKTLEVKEIRIVEADKMLDGAVLVSVEIILESRDRME